ncbi:hypothetical protein HG531_008147 [Fusarium graminearum]|nr:hypothetical protein HG531_008147 [Fusarium graminearum]
MIAVVDTVNAQSKFRRANFLTRAKAFIAHAEDALRRLWVISKLGDTEAAEIPVVRRPITAVTYGNRTLIDKSLSTIDGIIDIVHAAVH